MRLKVTRIIRYILAILLIMEGAYYTLGILSILFIRHMILLEPRCLLMLLGGSLWKNSQYSKELALGYAILALFATAVFKVDLIVLTPIYSNILYGLGLLPQKSFSGNELTVFVIVFICYRLLLVILTLMVSKR